MQSWTAEFPTTPAQKPAATNGGFQEVQFNDFPQAMVTSGKNHDDPAIIDTTAEANRPLAKRLRLAPRKASTCRVGNAGRYCPA